MGSKWHKTFGTPEERYWQRVIINPDPDGCWGWSTTSAEPDRYGVLIVRGQKRKWVHRLSWEIHNGPIPAGLEVMHACDNPPCSNPKHLSVGTHAENMGHSWVREGRRDRTKTPRQKGEGKSKLTAEQVCEIRRLHAEGRSYRSIGPQFSIAATTVRQICLRQTWRFLS